MTVYFLCQKFNRLFIPPEYILPLNLTAYCNTSKFKFTTASTFMLSNSLKDGVLVRLFAINIEIVLDQLI
jgi:hypothetical protein